MTLSELTFHKEENIKIILKTKLQFEKKNKYTRGHHSQNLRRENKKVLKNSIALFKKNVCEGSPKQTNTFASVRGVLE